jgi:hypothetical protein
VAAAPDQFLDDIDALKAVLIGAQAKFSGAEALIQHLQQVIEKLRRERFGPRSERSQRLFDQMELELEELAEVAGEDAVKGAEARAGPGSKLHPPQG